MGNMKDVARLALAMVRLSLPTLDILVLSSGTAINHMSVMAPSFYSYGDLQEKLSPKIRAKREARERLWPEKHSQMNSVMTL